MLVISRKLQEQILIGDDIRITIVSIGESRVRIGIDAPDEKKILRIDIDKPNKNVVSNKQTLA